MAPYPAPLSRHRGDVNICHELTTMTAVVFVGIYLLGIPRPSSRIVGYVWRLLRHSGAGGD